MKYYVEDSSGRRFSETQFDEYDSKKAGQRCVEITLWGRRRIPWVGLTLTCELESNEAFVSGTGPTPSVCKGQSVLWNPLPSLCRNAVATYRVQIIKPAGVGPAIGSHRIDEEGRVLRLCRLFSFVLRQKTRSRIFQPTFEELKEDYALMPQLKCGKWERRWIGVCFVWRGFWMVLDCARIGAMDRTVSSIAKFGGITFRNWWSKHG